jgi:hypothetical protein
MASWTDNIPQFNPHVETLPVDAYISVGMAKQVQYERGLEQIKGAVSQISGLPVAREIDKQYVSQALKAMQDGIRNSNTTDFGNTQLVNQIQGAASKIVSDPIVQKSLSSAVKIKNGYSQLEEAKKGGKSSVQNEWAYNSQVQSFMNSQDLNEEFRGNYTPYVDVLDEFRTIFKETFPDEALAQNPVIKYDEKGRMISVIDETTKKEISPEKVRRVWNIVKSRPEVANQLQIDGEFRYRNYTPDQLHKYVTENAKANIEYLNDRIKDIQLRAATDASSDAVALTNEIKGIRTQMAEAQKAYEEIANIVKDNPNAAKSYLYNTDFTNNLIGAFSYSQTSSKILDSPIYDAWMKNEKFELELNQFEENKRHNKATEEISALKSIKDKTKNDKDGDGVDDFSTITVPGNIKEEQGKLDSASFNESLNSQIGQANQMMYKGVYEIAQSDKSGINPIRLSRNGGYELNVDPSGTTGYKSIEEARNNYRKIYTASREAQMKGTATPKVKQMFDSLDPLLGVIKIKQAKAEEIESSFKANIPEKLRQSKNINVTARIGKINKDIVINTADLIDLWAVNNERSSSSQRRDAIKRLEDKFNVLGTNALVKLQDQVKWNKDVQAHYKEVSSELGKDKSTVSVFQQREDKYKDAQSAYQNKDIVIIAGKAEQKEQLRGIYSVIANSIAEGNRSKDAKKIATLTVNSDKKADDNLYGVKQRDGKYYITVTRGDEVAELEVTQTELAQIPGAYERNQFISKFGDKMEMTRFTTTDVPIKGQYSGEYTAYTVPSPSNSKYNVRYHVTGDGTNFDFEIYVRDKEGNLLLGPYALGLSTSMEGIVRSEKELANDVIIDALVQKNKR